MKCLIELTEVEDKTLQQLSINGTGSHDSEPPGGGTDDHEVNISAKGAAPCVD